MFFNMYFFTGIFQPVKISIFSFILWYPVIYL
nr:MAG TPA: hypothetical protein [Caudoviricetes sp.]